MKLYILIILTFISTLTYSQDIDNDSVLDNDDNCPTTSNSSQADEDGDRIGDACDICLGKNETGDTDNNGICDDLDPVLSILAKELLDLNIYPNPASDYVHINYPDYKKYHITLYSILGQEVLESNLKIIDLYKLPRGIYYLNASDDSDKKRIVNKTLLIK
ncbi:MAG: hypothetical protein ACI9IP_002798 [Arcticibacterium sp.]|jgi:hypothetical protein